MSDVLLQIDNVNYESEGSGVLKDVSLTIEEGQDVVFFGPENSGIGLVFKLILGLVDKYEGNILYRKQAVKEFNYFEMHQYRKNLGYLHGEYGLLSNLSVEGNISLPLEYHSQYSGDEIKKRVHGLIYEMNLDHCKKLRPIDLTKSEILRTAYARSVVLDPDLLLIENAFENQSALNILSFIDNLKKRAVMPGKSVLFGTYEPEKFLDFADSFVMMFNGRVVFHGPCDEYIRSNNEYLKQFRNLSVYGPMTIL